jgi:hypothetical protein
MVLNMNSAEQEEVDEVLAEIDLVTDVALDYALRTIKKPKTRELILHTVLLQKYAYDAMVNAGLPEDVILAIFKANNPVNTATAAMTAAGK